MTDLDAMRELACDMIEDEITDLKIEKAKAKTAKTAKDIRESLPWYMVQSFDAELEG